MSGTSTERDVRVYVVTVDDRDSIVSARSRSAARYDRFLDWTDATSGSFREFLSLGVRTRLSPVAPPRYDYIRERYGLDVGAGDTVHYGVEKGIVAAPDHPRVCLVDVFLDGVENSLPFHPSELSRTDPAVDAQRSLRCI